MDKEAILRAEWLAGVPADLIARHLGMSRRKMLLLRKKYGIPDRPNKYRKRIVDPTPDEIAERARECRERHYADRRREPLA